MADERERRYAVAAVPKLSGAARQRIVNRAPAAAVRVERPGVAPTKKQLDYRARVERWERGDKSQFFVSKQVDAARRAQEGAAPSSAIPNTGRGRALQRAIAWGTRSVSAGGALGARYVFGASGLNNTYDCSSLTQRFYAKVGIKLPRVSRDQFRVGRAVSKKNLRPGDLLFWSGTWRSGISHVAIYLGNGKMLEAPGTGKRVRIVPARINARNYAGARRVI